MTEKLKQQLELYFSKNGQTCTLVGPSELTQSILEEYREERTDEDIFVVQLPLYQGQEAEALPLEKTWKFWRAVVRKYAQILPADKFRTGLFQGTIKPETVESELETIQNVYSFFEKDYVWEEAAEQFAQSVMQAMGMSKEEWEEAYADQFAGRCCDETMSWIRFVYQQWANEDVEWLRKRLYAKRHCGEIPAEIDIVKEIMRIAKRETPQACVPLFDPETKFTNEIRAVREYVEELEYDLAEKRIAETEDAFAMMAKEEARYQAAESYQRSAISKLEQLRNAYMKLGVSIRLIISGFEQAEQLYPETDNIGSLFTDLFSISSKSITITPDRVMLVSVDRAGRYSHHLAVGSDFDAAYPAIVISE